MRCLGRQAPVMAGPAPAIHAPSADSRNVGARDKAGHDELGDIGAPQCAGSFSNVAMPAGIA